jgi:CheY-like chemotaxis protein
LTGDAQRRRDRATAPSLAILTGFYQVGKSQAAFATRQAPADGAATPNFAASPAFPGVASRWHLGCFHPAVVKKSRLHSPRRRTVLIAEDDEVIGRIVMCALQKEGFRPQLVTDGIAAINLILDRKPDLIVLDMILPRLQGADICAMIRKSRPVRHTPIIVISGCADLADKLQTFNLGADDYVTKPFSADELVARVEAVWQRSRHRCCPTAFLDENLC